MYYNRKRMNWFRWPHLLLRFLCISEVCGKEETFSVCLSCGCFFAQISDARVMQLREVPYYFFSILCPIFVFIVFLEVNALESQTSLLEIFLYKPPRQAEQIYYRFHSIQKILEMKTVQGNTFAFPRKLVTQRKYTSFLGLCLVQSISLLENHFSNVHLLFMKQLLNKIQMFLVIYSQNSVMTIVSSSSCPIQLYWIPAFERLCTLSFVFFLSFFSHHDL